MKLRIFVSKIVWEFRSSQRGVGYTIPSKEPSLIISGLIFVVLV